jgi:copper/silver efflux system protein
MIGRILELSARHRALVILCGIALAVAGAFSAERVELDAIPDLSEPQVIVFTEWPGRSPTLVEDQITYPLVTALLAAPNVHEVRGQSMLGMSFVYVVFEEGTDLYWARSRVLELLSGVERRLPEGAETRVGPDASGIGWVYQYAVVDETGEHDTATLRALHDYSIRYALASVPGVAEVATVGGFEPEYQITVDPVKLRALGVSLREVADAVRRGNGEVGGRVLELSEREAYVRGRGYFGKTEDIEAVVIRASQRGAPLLVRDVGSVRVGGAQRRGAADLDGRGEVVSGIVVARHGENALLVVERVEERIRELSRTLPPGVEIRPVYDRSGLIERSIETLKRSLLEEMIVVALVIVGFLLHLRSALLPIVTLPLAVVAAFIPMVLFGVPATIMSLGGIAIAIGATVDAEIVMVEAAHKKLESAPPDLSEEDRRKLLADSAKEVTPAIFFSLLIVAVSFLPVFGLTGQAGRLFRPLAFTKTFVMLSAALLSITLAPALRDLLLRGKIRSEADHPVSRAIRRVYAPFVHVALKNPRTTLLIGALAVASAVPLVPHLGTEFMPPLDEGDILYMPTSFPGIAIEEAREQLQRQDAALRELPEVESVLGKVGRADSPTDPAPLSMVETVVRLKPRSAWRTRFRERWYHGTTPAFVRPLLTSVWPEFEPLTREELVAEMNAKLRFPGFTNAFTQPIKNRVDMLTTGIRTPVGIKVYGRDLTEIERAGASIEGLVRTLPSTRSALFERQQGGTYVDVVPDREALARHGLAVADVQELVELGVGTTPLTTVVDGRVRVGVTLRYAQDFRSTPDALHEALLPLPEGRGEVRLGDVAKVSITEGPPMVRDDAGMLVGYVYVDVDEDVDLGGYVAALRARVEQEIARGAVVLPEGGRIRYTGQYELIEETHARLKILVPIALLVVTVLLWLQFKDLTEVLIVLLSVPFALVGSVWALFLLGFHLSTAVWVGMIALLGLATQTGVVMIVYIDQAFERRKREGRMTSLDDIVAAHAEGTIERVRPKLMTVGTMLVGLVPLLWSTGSGADVMKRIAAPMIGGLLTSAFLTLEIIPVVYTYWRWEQLVRERLREAEPARFAELERMRALASLGGVLSVGALAARFYASEPGRWPLVLTFTGLTALLGGGLAYALFRSRLFSNLNLSQESS